MFECFKKFKFVWFDLPKKIKKQPWKIENQSAHNRKLSKYILALHYFATDLLQSAGNRYRLHSFGISPGTADQIDGGLTARLNIVDDAAPRRLQSTADGAWNVLMRAVISFNIDKDQEDD